MKEGPFKFRRLATTPFIETSEPNFRKGSMLSKKGLRDGLNDDSC